jgi:biotin carboxyl carrier protein
MSKINVTIEDHTYEVEVNLHQRGGSELTVAVDGEELQVIVSNLDNFEQLEWIQVGNRSYEIVVDRDLRWIKTYAGLYRLEVRDLESPVTRPQSADGRVKAPIPGLITRVMVKPGDQVEVGQPLLVLEAMKMENEIHAPCSGAVTQLNVKPGQSVALQETLVEIE